MRQFRPVSTYLLLPAVLAFAQAKPESPVFTAADVHVSPRRAESALGGGILRGERYEIRNATLVELILLAYGLDENKLIGQPLWLTASLRSKVAGGSDWLHSDKFDIIAAAPRGTSPDDLRLMLQALLAERFKLAVHREKRAVQGYGLKAGPNPLLKKSSEDSASCQYQRIPHGSEPDAPYDLAMNCHGYTMAELAAQLPGMASDYIANTLTDTTGLEGRFDFVLRWTPRGQPGGTGPGMISLFDALDKQLGLTTEARKVAIDVVVVEHAGRTPVENPRGTLQKLPSLPSEFEVATVRSAAADPTRRRFVLQPSGRFEANGTTLGELVLFAWDIPPDMLDGAPRWFGTTRFDIVAKVPADAVSAGLFDRSVLRPMVRALLSNRFRLVSHFDQRPVSVYAMSVVRQSPNLRKSTSESGPDCRSTPPPPDTPVGSPLTASWRCQNVSMALFANKLQEMAPAYVDHMAIDSTGLDGTWDLSLRWTPIGMYQRLTSRPDADPSGALSLSEALERQLGIKLMLEKRTMPVLVVDSVDQTPSEN